MSALLIFAVKIAGFVANDRWHRSDEGVSHARRTLVFRIKSVGLAARLSAGTIFYAPIDKCMTKGPFRCHFVCRAIFPALTRSKYHEISVTVSTLAQCRSAE